MKRPSDMFPLLTCGYILTITGLGLDSWRLSVVGVMLIICSIIFHFDSRLEKLEKKP